MRPLAVLLCLALALAAGGYAVQRNLPERYNPFAPLSIAERPTFLTGWKLSALDGEPAACFAALDAARGARSEEHTSELQSLMRISYAVFCLTKKKQHQLHTHTRTTNI